MFGIRQKLMLGFAGLLAVVAIIGGVTMQQISRLGRSIDVILQENYRSVIACQDMKESLERIDSGLLFTMLGHDAEGRRYIDISIGKFRAAMKIELANITVPGERETAERIHRGFSSFTALLPQVVDTSRSTRQRQQAYFSTLLPLFLGMKADAQHILEMNQRSMYDANAAARREARLASRRLLLAIIACVLIATTIGLLVQRWVLRPIHRLIESADEIRMGNLDLVLRIDTRDEIGQLSQAFNHMAVGLRQIRRKERIELDRSRRVTEEVFRVLPEAIAVVDLGGRIDMATETAARQFAMKPGSNVNQLAESWLADLVARAQAVGGPVEYGEGNNCIQRFIENREHFFRPSALVTRDCDGETNGTVVILRDVTQEHEQLELKQSVISTVSHQLKTPLTSLRMSIHLLLDNVAGALNEKQAELLLAARDDSERLAGILDDLLDINRIEAGRALMEFTSCDVRQLIDDSVVPFRVDARDRGISLIARVEDDLPAVNADPGRIQHVFANLLANALRFTKPGGEIELAAMSEKEFVRFQVRDTGVGIPGEYLSRIFDMFFRVPGQEDHSGAGLGLAIVREIVSVHGGEVGVESTQGVGSTFWFTLLPAGRNAASGNGAGTERR
jgi:two-component system, NtrC family, sensor histidine kinase KinB